MFRQAATDRRRSQQLERERAEYAAQVAALLSHDPDVVAHSSRRVDSNAPTSRADSRAASSHHISGTGNIGNINTVSDGRAAVTFKVNVSHRRL